MQPAPGRRHVHGVMLLEPDRVDATRCVHRDGRILRPGEGVKFEGQILGLAPGARQTAARVVDHVAGAGGLGAVAQQVLRVVAARGGRELDAVDELALVDQLRAHPDPADAAGALEDAHLLPQHGVDARAVPAAVRHRHGLREVGHADGRVACHLLGFLPLALQALGEANRAVLRLEAEVGAVLEPHAAVPGRQARQRDVQREGVDGHVLPAPRPDLAHDHRALAHEGEDVVALHRDVGQRAGAVVDRRVQDTVGPAAGPDAVGLDPGHEHVVPAGGHAAVRGVALAGGDGSELEVGPRGSRAQQDQRGREESARASVHRRTSVAAMGNSSAINYSTQCDRPVRRPFLVCGRRENLISCR